MVVCDRTYATKATVTKREDESHDDDGVRTATSSQPIQLSAVEALSDQRSKSTSLVTEVAIPLLPVLSGRFVDWAERWPCHNSPNCVEGGAHSGFNVGWMALPDSKVWFVPHESVIELTRYLKSHPPPPQRRLGASAAGRRGLNATT